MDLLDKKHYFCSMIELAKHIEVLLLENDCVIVPGLGGFIAHNRQAEFKESNGLFCAPMRTIGFNPQLVMNDGLLVQTYMQAYNTDFPDATRKIEETVSTLKEQLYKTGEANLPNVGTLYYTMNGTYVFEPASEVFFTPYLYGLGNFALTPLKALKRPEETVTIHPFITPRQESAEPMVAASYKSHGRTFRRLARHTVGLAAAILLFFLLSIPVENTYMDDASYASLSAESMFDAIRGRSVATHLICADNDDKQKAIHRTKHNVNTLKPVSVRTETVAKPEAEPAVKKEPAATPAPVKKETPAPAKKEAVEKVAPATKVAEVIKEAPKAAPVKAEPKPEKAAAVKKADSKGYYIIVASLASTADAQKQLKAFQSKGYTEASVLNTDQHHRIALYRFNESSEAYKKLKELRKQEDFKNSWVFTAK